MLQVKLTVAPSSNKESLWFTAEYKAMSFKGNCPFYRCGGIEITKRMSIIVAFIRTHKFSLVNAGFIILGAVCVIRENRAARREAVDRLHNTVQDILDNLLRSRQDSSQFGDSNAVRTGALDKPMVSKRGTNLGASHGDNKNTLKVLEQFKGGQDSKTN